MAEKDGDKEEETEREAVALNVLCSSSTLLYFIREMRDHSSLSSLKVFSRSNSGMQRQDRKAKKGLNFVFFPLNAFLLMRRLMIQSAFVNVHPTLFTLISFSFGIFNSGFSLFFFNQFSRKMCCV